MVLRLPATLAESSFDRVFPRSDGKMVVVGRFETDRRSAVVIERRMPDGQLDPSFGKDGELLLPTRVLGEDGRGRIFVVGGSNCPADSLQRLDADGRPDTSFGANGCGAPVPFHPALATSAADGRILVAGTSFYGPPQPGLRGTPPAEETDVARLLPDGSLDGSFGNGGVVRSHGDFGIETDPPNALGLADIVLTADGGASVAADRAVLRLTSSGRLDQSFGNKGLAPIEGVIEDLLLLPDGKVLVAGTCCSEGDPIELTRLLPDGSRDPSYGVNGVVKVDDGASNASVEMAELPDGDLMLAVSGNLDGCGRICRYVPLLVRLNPDGTLDNGYGDAGVAGLDSTSCSDDGSGHPGLAIDSSGRTLLVAGPSIGDACLQARTVSGELDPDFGRDGVVVETRPEPSASRPLGISVEPNGAIVVMAHSDAGSHSERPVFLRVRPNGTLDRRLGSGASFVPTPGGRELHAGRDGHLFSLGNYRGAWRILELSDRGKPIASYGSRGVAAIPAALRPRFFLARRNDEVLVFGRIKEGGMGIFRLRPNGRPDRSFAHGGLRVIRFGGRHTQVRSALIEPDGRIVLVGLVGPSAAATRLLPNGRLDRTFGNRGLVAGLLGRGTVATAVVRRGDGLAIACTRERDFKERSSILVALERHGGRDRSFGRGGVVRPGGKGAPLALFGSKRRIVLLAARGDDGEDGFVAQAFGPRGKHDPGFGSHGRVTVAPTGKERLTAKVATRGRDGSIVVAAAANFPHGEQVELIRLR